MGRWHFYVSAGSGVVSESSLGHRTRRQQQVHSSPSYTPLLQTYGLYPRVTPGAPLTLGSLSAPPLYTISCDPNIQVFNT